jgi:RNA recognition motif-containing protein
LKNIFVGNLDSAYGEDQLRDLFAAHGRVESVTVVKDRDTGQPRGFAFVEMIDSGEAQAAILALDGTIQNGRALRVNEPRPKPVQDMNTNSHRNRDHRRHQI